MKKIFMLTRGRTGSSAILDELVTENIYSVEELVADFSGKLMRDTAKEYPRTAPPFDIWKEIVLNTDSQTWGEMFDVVQESLDAKEKMFCLLITTLNNTVPFLLNNNWIFGRKVEQYLLGRYLDCIERQASEGAPGGMFREERFLDDIEKQASENKKEALIFKVLSANLRDRKSLLGVLKSRGYRSLFLVRKNVVRLVLSLLLAHYRSQAERKNMYYKRGHVGEIAPCKINLDEFERHVKLEQKCVADDRALLTKSGIDYLEVTYEDFCEDRDKFYSEIFHFMGVEYKLPKNTTLSIMVPDIRKAVANYDELEARISAMGMKDLL